MNLRRVTLHTATAILACALAAVADANAQSATVFVGGLKAPTKIVLTPKGNLLVAEAGQGPNTGRISLVDRRTHERRTILDGLPAGASADGGQSGPSGLALDGRTIFVTIGGGDATIAGPAQGTEKPNPNPSSPILSSLLAVQSPANFEEMTSGFSLAPSDHAALNEHEVRTLSNAQGGSMRIEMLTNFPDFEDAPRPDFQENVRVANPFGVAQNGRLLYVVDASLNKLSIVGADTGSRVTLKSFFPISNPLPFGPPVTDAVPDSVRLVGDQLLITTLTGFPFPTGSARVLQVDTVTGGGDEYVNNLTSAIDVLTYQGAQDKFSQNALGSSAFDPTLRLPNSDTHFLVLEFSTDFLQNAPGRLLVDSNDSAPVVLAAPLISPTSMARDSHNGDIFITSIFPGLVVRVSFARELTRGHYKDFLGREPDREGWDFWAGEIERCGTDAACFERKSVDVSRAFFYSAEFIARHPELAEGLRGTASYNREFVRQCYFAYLRRDCDPEVCDSEGFNFWVTKLNGHLPNVDADYNEMIRAFLISSEYRARFGLS
jgi:hypothetical protein